jgi:hypothetical protein
MYSTYLFLALDTARERTAEAERRRQAALTREPGTPGPFRRLVARGAVAVARAADETTLQQGATAC